MLFNNQPIQIIDVWEDNFIEEIQKISDLLPRYNYIAMVSLTIHLDSSFAGTLQPANSFLKLFLTKPQADFDLGY